MSTEGVWAIRNLTFEILDSTTIQPSSPSSLQPGHEIHTALSISDGNKTGWGQAAGVWFFNPPAVPVPGQESYADEKILSHLKIALSQVLNGYRPWCGRLLVRPCYRDPETQEIKNYGRLELVNRADDPGLLFVTAKCPCTLESLVPNIKERSSSHVFWDASKLDQMAWLPEQAVANPLGKPGTRSDDDHVVAVKLTLFEDGAAAIAVKISHACADAHSVSQFINEWAAISRALLKGTEPQRLKPPLFASHLVDDLAGDNTIAAIPNAKLVAQAKNLPVHRFDSWASLPDQIPLEFKHSAIATTAAGDELPLADMGMASTKLHYVVHFNPVQVHKLWESAASKNVRKTPLSHQDVLLAHIWSRTNIARGLQEDEDAVFCNFMVGFRSRIQPPLGDGFVGSPFAVAFSQGRAVDVCEPSKISSTAALIRSTIRQFNTETVGSLMHLWAYDSCPMRIWGYMTGKRHLMVTSWLREGVNVVDFGFGEPRFIRMDLPSVDGMVQVMEAPKDSEPGNESGNNNETQWGWDVCGVDISICLVDDVMKKLLEDPSLLP